VIDRLIDRMDAAFASFSGVLAVIGLAWIVATGLQYAGFVQLPDFALFQGVPALVGSVIYNAVYWGFVYPRVLERRAERMTSMNGKT
jgi:hypothetical protein